MRDAPRRAKLTGLPADLEQYCDQEGWHAGKNGQPILMQREAYGINRPDVKFDLSRWVNRSTWVWRDTGWKQIEDRVRWVDMYDPVVAFNPTELNIIVRYDEDAISSQETEVTPLRDAEERSIRKGRTYVPYLVRQRDGAIVMMATYKKGFKSDLLQKKQQDKGIAWRDILEKDIKGQTSLRVV